MTALPGKGEGLSECLMLTPETGSMTKELLFFKKKKYSLPIFNWVLQNPGDDNCCFSLSPQTCYLGNARKLAWFASLFLTNPHWLSLIPAFSPFIIKLASKPFFAHLSTIQPVTTIQAENLPLGLQLPPFDVQWMSWLLINCKRFTCDQVKWHRQWWENWSYLLDGKGVWPSLSWTSCCSLWSIPPPCSLRKSVFYNSSSFAA